MVKQLTALTLGNRWFTIAYLLAGAIVSGSHGYFDHLSAVRQIVVAVLPLGLWPLLWRPGIRIY